MTVGGKPNGYRGATLKDVTGLVFIETSRGAGAYNSCGWNTRHARSSLNVERCHGENQDRFAPRGAYYFPADFRAGVRPPLDVDVRPRPRHDVQGHHHPV